MIREIALQEEVSTAPPVGGRSSIAKPTLARALFGYFFAAAALVLATLVRESLRPYLGSHVPFSCYYVAVIFVAWIGGLGPAAFTIFAGCLLAEYLFIPPFANVFPVGVENWIGLTAYFVVCSSVVLLTEGLKSERQKLAIAKADTQEIIENVGEAIIAIGSGWRIKFLNRTAEQMFGVNRDHLVGKNAWELVPQFRGTPMADAYESAMSNRRTVRMEDFFAPTGKWYWIEVSPLESGGVTARYLDITDEVKERHSIQQRLLALESMNELAVARQTFSGRPEMEADRPLFSPWY